MFIIVNIGARNRFHSPGDRILGKMIIEAWTDKMVDNRWTKKRLNKKGFQPKS
jgi:hypothetical protein